MPELNAEQRLLVRDSDPKMSDDPAVQRALERIPCEMAATYNLAARCWVWITLGQGGTIEDVAIVRKLCQQRELGVREHQIIDQAKKVAWARVKSQVA
jgi:hypothetical protein